MLASEQFNMRLSRQDRAMLQRVAEHLQRSQADAIKTLVRGVYELITDQKIGDPKPSQEEPASL